MPEDVDWGDDGRFGPDFAGGGLRMTNGNLLHSRSDLNIVSPHRSGLGFAAHYNSRSTWAGSLGHGWTHTYSIHLDENVTVGSQSLIRIQDADGRGSTSTAWIHTPPSSTKNRS